MARESPLLAGALTGAEASVSWEIGARLGEGASAIVYAAVNREDGARAAVKIARAGFEGVVIAEADVLFRVRPRWAPRLLDAGRTKDGHPWIAISRAEGEAMNLAKLHRASREERERTCAIVAHGVARALSELHAANIRHGDVKPANVVLRPSASRRDRADDRAATLVDLGLAAEASASVTGGTPRYMSPADGAELGPPADMFALGVLLAEILSPDVANAKDPRGQIASEARGGLSRSHPSSGGEITRWIDALTAPLPGGRPNAAWIADRAAAWLALEPDDEERVAARTRDVERAYLAVRAPEFDTATAIDPSIDGVAREWLKSAIFARGRVRAKDRDAAVLTMAPLSSLRRARWLVALAGARAATWPASDLSEGSLAARLVALASEHAPETWVASDLAGARRAPARSEARETPEPRPELWLELVRALARPRVEPDVLARAEREVARGDAPAALAVDLAEALLRAGEIGRAWAAARGVLGARASALRAELARRRGDTTAATREAEAAESAEPVDVDARARARAIRARVAWDAGDLDGALSLVENESGPYAAEVRALVAYARGKYEDGLEIAAIALAETNDPERSARLEATRGMLEHARGRASAALVAFSRAAEAAAREGAVIDEATYLTGEAAAATDAGEIARALDAATRGALLWERLGRSRNAARALLSRAAALVTVGAIHEACEASLDARARARASSDAVCAAFARWVLAARWDTLDPRAAEEALGARDELDAAGAGEEDRVRALARCLLHAPDRVSREERRATDARVASLGATARWEWWSARAAATATEAGGVRGEDAREIVTAISALVDVVAPLDVRGAALDRARIVATEAGDGEAARRFETARISAAESLRAATPAAYRAALSHVAWARAGHASESGVALGAAQIAELESIARALGERERLRPLLEQVLDAMVLWAGVERGLLLLRAPDGSLRPRAARNLARRDLHGEQLALSMGLARRAMETRDAVVATDALASLGDYHASVHALGLRSVLAVPLVARGDVLGVVYLDDRARRGAFGARELAWVRLVAGQAATAIADARDQVLLRRAVRKAERAKAALAARLGEREMELETVRTELSIAREDTTRFRYDEIHGSSEKMREMLHVVDRVTATDVPVLVVGESGTGKELVARALHANGARKKRAFVSENCAAVPEQLLESTLFGHVRGAFTGASTTRVGLFDVADGGTLFLDEIGEMTGAMQAKLLRVLQDGEVRAVGGASTHRVDVRVIAATNRDLEAMVARGAFREDLYYRLNVVTIRVPPLRERRDDIAVLARHFLAKHAPEGDAKITRAAMERLMSFPWPGNVRQLENEVRRALVLGEQDGAHRIDVAELSPEVARVGPGAARAAGHSLRARVDALEEELVRDALSRTKGNQTRAAEILGVSRFGLQKMMRRLGVRV